MRENRAKWIRIKAARPTLSECDLADLQAKYEQARTGLALAWGAYASAMCCDECVVDEYNALGVSLAEITRLARRTPEGTA